MIRKAYYGAFGGQYVAESVMNTLAELEKAFDEAVADPKFWEEYNYYLREYVGRETPLYLAERLSEKYGTKIYLKREDLNHTGAHKINNVIGQILLAKHMGKQRIIAETGAGQHGVATATVCALMKMPCTIYMGATDVARQRPNVEKMRLLGAKVVAVESGNKTLKDAVNEALQDWCSHPEETFYLLGSAVGPHPYPDLVTRLQSVISKEIRAQLLEKEGREVPDYLVACIGGGSNAGGTFFHFLEEPDVKFILAEGGGLGAETKETAATLTIGTEGVLHGSRSLVIQDEYGNVAEPYSISAGLDYPGIGPLHATLVKTGRAQALAITDHEALAAAYELNRLDGILPALESAHALGALHRLKFKPSDIVVLTVSGRGDKDIDTYLKHAGEFAAENGMQ